MIDVFEKYSVDELIDIRQETREQSAWIFSDKIRDYLDSKFVFIFDTKEGQEVHFLYESYFDKKPSNQTNRQYVEHIIQRDIRANNNFDAWLYSMQNNLN